MVPNHTFLFQYTYLSLQHEKYCIPNNISYGFITLELKSRQLLQHYQFWLYPTTDRKIWHYKKSKFCTSPHRCRTKKNGNSDFFDVIQDVFADIQAFLFSNFWIPKYHCLEKVYRHSEFRLQT